MSTSWKKVISLQKVIGRRAAMGWNQQQHKFLFSRSLMTSSSRSFYAGNPIVAVTSSGMDYCVRQYYTTRSDSSNPPPPTQSSSNQREADVTTSNTNTRLYSESSIFDTRLEDILNNPMWLIPRKGTGM
jgi:hypothetical protein